MLRDIRLTNSGDSHDSDDACVNVRKHNNTVENVTIDDCLFGIDLKQPTTTSSATTAFRRRCGTSACAETACVSGTATTTGSRGTASSTRATWSRGIPTTTPSSTTSVAAAAIPSISCSRHATWSRATASTTMPSACMSCIPAAAPSATTSSRTPPAPPAWAIGFKEASDVTVEEQRDHLLRDRHHQRHLALRALEVS